MADFVIPELGEGVAGGDVVRVMVKPGDALKKDQPVLELETDKATIEVPSNVAGVVKELKIKTGDKVKVGQVVLTLDEALPPPLRPGTCGRSYGGQGRGTGQGRPAARSRADPAAAKHEDLAGAEPPPGEDAHIAPSKVVDIGRAAPARPAAAASTAGAPVPSGGGLVPAAPSTRRTARELGVDITQVEGSGPGGRISVDDVKGYARSVLTGGGGGARRGCRAGRSPDFTQWGEVEVQPMRNIRRVTAERLSAAWATIPHVTQCDKSDITELEKLRQKYAKAGGEGRRQAHHHRHRAEGHRGALKKFPQFNARSTWPARRSCSRSTCTSAWPSTPTAA